MKSNVIRFVASDLVLGIFQRGVMGVSFILQVLVMDFDDCSGDPSCFRIPAYAFSDLE
jgi:hypothetical protein